VSAITLAPYSIQLAEAAYQGLIGNLGMLKDSADVPFTNTESLAALIHLDPEGVAVPWVARVDEVASSLAYANDLAVHITTHP
jgi:hypothetical protein